MNGPIVITGGGTGGHIFPMQAVAEQLQRRGVTPGALRYVGSRRGQESTLLGHGPIGLTLLPGRGIRRSWRPDALVANAGAVAGLVAAVVIAVVKVGWWRPRVVVSVGGYASFAVAFAAVLWRRPLVLVELDAAPGAAHRVLGRFASARCTAFVADGPNDHVTGAPVRDAVLSVDRSNEARRSARRSHVPAIEEARRVIVVMTGSLGAASVNRAVSELARRWSHRLDVAILHVTGRRDHDATLAARPPTEGLDYRILAFGDMAELWALCDVAVCRAGATTIAELTALAIPAILVPLPGAPGDHQTRNALVLARAGAARLVNDADCTGETLATILDEVLAPEVTSSMSDAAASLGHRDAAAAIASVVADVGGFA
jgi:UDP-N-acetylglucosamine--N-acetylmuramyl-(pentapeptide) pyrophosphoryl-undecaprenol N-acetylglucosamine transferase